MGRLLLVVFAFVLFAGGACPTASRIGSAVECEDYDGWAYIVDECSSDSGHISRTDGITLSNRTDQPITVFRGPQGWTIPAQTSGFIPGDGTSWVIWEK